VIRRVNDSDIFSNETLKKIAEVVEKKENIKLFDIVDSEAKANLIKKELKVQGYQVKIEKHGDKFKVFAIIPDKVKFQEAVESGAFKKLAWGRYSFQKEAGLGMFKYDFDEGTIWRVMTGEDGQDYLIKEVDDEMEDEVVRTKTASNDEIMINDNNVKTVLKILYDNLDQNDFIRDVLSSSIKPQIYSMLNEKLVKVIDQNIDSNQFVKSPQYVADLKGVVKIAINESKIDSKKQLENLVLKYTEELVAATGKIQKLFN
jgi:hypothetical protein